MSHLENWGNFVVYIFGFILLLCGSSFIDFLVKRKNQKEDKIKKFKI